MKLPISWLQQFVPVKHTINEVADIFYNLGFEVESIENNVVDLEITSNRGDALSILGLAREYAAATDQKIKNTPMPIEAPTNNHDITINLETNKINGYIGILLKNITVTKSPDWIRDLLVSIGVSPINNIVDATNFVMFELGQPLHAFDLDKIDGQVMTITQSAKEETLKTLNQKTYAIPVNSVVALDQNKVIDLVGIQGGTDTGISSLTTAIYLHGLGLDSKNIRATSKALKLSTDASYRYERGVDPTAIEPAVARVIEIIQQTSTVDIELVTKQEANIKIKEINYDGNVFERITGTAIKQEQSANILQRLGFVINDSVVTVPGWRYADISFPEDLVEEIARVYGYNNLTRTPLPLGETSDLPSEPDWIKQRTLAANLSNLGFSEIMTYSFLSQKEATGTELVTLANSLSNDHKYLRSSLIPLLVRAAEANTWFPDIKLFEIGHIFTNSEEKTIAAVISNTKIDFLTNPQIHENDSRRKYYVWEGPIEELLKCVPIITPKHMFEPRQYQPFSKFPPVTRDIAFVVNNSINLPDIRNTIFNVDPRILLVDLFDEFQSEKLGQGSISYAFHIVIDDTRETMTNETGDKIMHEISNQLVEKYQAKIR